MRRRPTSVEPGEELLAGLRAAGISEAVLRGHCPPLSASGAMEVQVRFGWLGDWIVSRLPLPRRGEAVPVSLCLERCEGSTRWTRKFGDRTSEALCAFEGGELFVERFGRTEIAYRWVVQEGVLSYRQVRFRLASIPVPAWLSPKIVSSVSPTENGWHVDVSVRLPILGEICHYWGEMVIQ